jgi:hypothetical protein
MVGVGVGLPSSTTYAFFHFFSLFTCLKIVDHRSYVQSVRLHNSRVLFLIRFSDAVFFVRYVWILHVEVSKKTSVEQKCFFSIG